jgi:hypothetical protein
MLVGIFAICGTQHDECLPRNQRPHIETKWAVQYESGLQTGRICVHHQKAALCDDRLK